MALTNILDVRTDIEQTSLAKYALSVHGLQRCKSVARYDIQLERGKPLPPPWIKFDIISSMESLGRGMLFLGSCHCERFNPT